MKKIRYVSADNTVAEWGDKSAVCKRFDGLKVKTLNSYLTEMRKNPIYSQYVINPSHKIVWINFEGFLSFLLYRQDRRYKYGKGA